MLWLFHLVCPLGSQVFSHLQNMSRLPLVALVGVHGALRSQAYTCFTPSVSRIGSGSTVTIAMFKTTVNSETSEWELLTSDKCASFTQSTRTIIPMPEETALHFGVVFTRKA